MNRIYQTSAVLLLSLLVVACILVTANYYHVVSRRSPDVDKLLTEIQSQEDKEAAIALAMETREQEINEMDATSARAALTWIQQAGVVVASFSNPVSGTVVKEILLLKNLQEARAALDMELLALQNMNNGH